MTEENNPQYPQPSYEVPVEPTGMAGTPPPAPTGQESYGNQAYYTDPNTQSYAHAVPTPVKGRGFGSARKEKWSAVALAYTLGWLGIHKFYLGYKNEGTIMMVISIVGAICTFGLGTIVMVIIAIVEAAHYVALTEEDFQKTYVEGRKGWF